MPLSSYQKLEKIGEGTYGVVYHAYEKTTARHVALKRIRPESENEGIPATTIREILLLKSLKHPNIIELIEVIHSEDRMYLVFEYLATDLKKLLDEHAARRRRLAPALVRRIGRQLCSAVAFCHARNVFHRDLKPQNILVSSDHSVKLADFGLARAASIPLREYTTEIVTLWYRAPELLLGSRYYDAAVDVWALACILAELHTLTPLFAGDSETDQLHQIFRVLGTPTARDWPGAAELPNYPPGLAVHARQGYAARIDDPLLVALLDKMLVYDPLRRITAEEALREPYFAAVD